MSAFEQELQMFSMSAYVELFDIDTTVIGGGTVYRFTPQSYSAANITWKGNTYTAFPIDVTGFEWSGTSNAPPTPTLTVSNVNKFLLAAVLSLGDLVGAKVTRWRTFQKFLDGQATPDPNAHFTPDIYLIDQKTTHNKEIIQWSLISPMDRQGLMLPKRQILKDEVSSSDIYFPGVAGTRF
jgi:lambda family phage minor tail protein L